MTDTELLDLLRSGFVLPKPDADFSTAGFMLRLKYRETTEEELRLLHETLSRAPTVTADVTGLSLAQYLFVIRSLFDAWREVYREQPESRRLISECVTQIERVMRVEEVLTGP